MYQIKSYQAQHLDDVAQLIVPIQREEFGIAISLEDQPDLNAIPNFYQHGTGNFWVAEAAGRVVGTIALLDIGDGQAALRKMFVARDYRGKELGLAAALLQTLLTWARSHAIEVIFLGTTDKFIAAHRFYEKHGFIEIAKSDLPISFPVMAIDSKFYRYCVTESSN